MTAHALGIVTVGQRAEGAKWTCSCGACGFCWPDGWTPDEDQRALTLWADAQEAHRRHVARAITTDEGLGCGFVGRPRRYCWGVGGQGDAANEGGSPPESEG